MIQTHYSKSGAFLIEMIFSVFFLAICICICLATFVKADAVSRRSRDETRAVFEVQNAAEEMKASPEDWTGRSGRELLASYSPDWQRNAEPSGDGFRLMAEPVLNDGLLSVRFWVESADKEILFSLEVRKYFSEGRLSS